MSSNFESYCETLWKQWITRDLELTPFIEKEFQTEYLPEPYLRFHSGSNPLYVLTTNPGRGMPEQHRSNINSQSILVGTEMSYHQIAFRMAAFYLNKLDGSSKRRIDSFIRLSTLGGYNSVSGVDGFLLLLQFMVALPSATIEEMSGDIWAMKSNLISIPVEYL